MDPNTLNFDTDPEFWPNLDPDPGPDNPGLCDKFFYRKHWIEKQFSKINIFFKNYKEMDLHENFKSLESLNGECMSSI